MRPDDEDEIPRPGDDPEEADDAAPPGDAADDSPADESAADESAADGGAAGEADAEGTAEGRVPVALAATDEPVELRIGLVEDERTPEGMVCMGTFRGERLIARCVMPPEAYQELEDYGVFEDPVPVVLVAQEAPPGLQCRLFAMIALPIVEVDEEDDDAEPWAASVPSSRYEETVAAQTDEPEEADEELAGDEDDEDDDEALAALDGDPQLVPLPLGNIVRYDRDRLFPESLPREAMDVLEKVINGRTYEVVDRALADLLDL